MTKLEIEIFDDVISTINKMRNINDNGIELIIPEGSVLFDNILNLKLIKQQADMFGITVQYSTQDSNGMSLIEMLEGNPEHVFSVNTDETELLQNVDKPKLNFKLSAMALPKFSFNSLGKFKILPILIALGIVFGFYLISKTPKANVNITVSSEPLTRSLTVKVKTDIQTNPESLILRGNLVQGDVETTLEADTTGTKTVGEKAKGKAIIYNKTEDNIKLKKGTVFTYKDNITYTLEKDTEIEALTPGSEPSDVGKAGSEEATIIAFDVGGSYNIDDDKDLTIKNYKSSKLAAVTEGKITGGKSEQMQVVSADDKTNLSKKILEQNTTTAQNFLKGKIGYSQKLIDGSIKNTVTKETFSNQVGEEAKKLTLTQTATATGLTYLPSDLDSILKSNISKLIPQGYTLSKSDWAVSVNVLSTDTTTNEAELQVTLKASVVPTLKTEDIQNQLAGKTVPEAEKVLGSIKSIKTYELSIKPSIPLLKKVPTDKKRIIINIENE